MQHDKKNKWSWDELPSGAAWQATYHEYVIVGIVTIVNYQQYRVQRFVINGKLWRNCQAKPYDVWEHDQTNISSMLTIVQHVQLWSSIMCGDSIVTVQLGNITTA